MKTIYLIFFMIAVGFIELKATETSSEAAFGQLSTYSTIYPTSRGRSKITFDSIETAQNIELSADKKEIIIKINGIYFLLFTSQVGATTPGARGYIDNWLIKNSKDLPNSGGRMTIDNMSTTIPLVSQYVLELKTGDVISIGFSASGPGLGLIFIQPDNQPAVASTSFSILKIN